MRVSRTRGKEISRGIETHVLYHICVTFKGRFVLTCLVIPYLWEKTENDNLKSLQNVELIVIQPRLVQMLWDDSQELLHS